MNAVVRFGNHSFEGRCAGRVHPITMLMSAAQPWAPLGELLVERGLLSKRQLELALQEHQRTGRRLGEVLVAFGFVSHDALTNTLLEQVGLAVEQPLRIAPPVVAAPEPPPPAPAPVIVRLDADQPRGNAVARKAAELEAQLVDFERRSAEIQAAIGEMRRLIADLRSGGKIAV
jgi:hypothetical protein